jgi:hypothetical protein
MIKKNLFLTSTILLLTGCVTGYTLVEPGPIFVGELTVDAGSGYNKAPRVSLSTQRKGSQSWTQDGLLLDRLTIIPAVADGEPLLKPTSKDAALPVFRKDMLPNEIEELLESTILKIYGEGNATVNTSNLRPHRYGTDRGILFDVSAMVTESPSYKGIVGAFIVQEHLYILWFLAAEPYYYSKHVQKAEAIIHSARLIGAE